MSHSTCRGFLATMMSSTLRVQMPRLARAYVTACTPCTAYTHVTHPDAASADGFATTLGTYARPPVVMTHGRGMDLFAQGGRRYLDFTGGIAVNALGHADPEVAKVASEQASELVHCSNLYFNTWSGAMANKLVEMTHQHGGLGTEPNSDAGLRVFVANSGTEANEAALKFARKAAPHGKKGLVCFGNAFHGRTMGALSVTPNEKYQAPFEPLIPDVRVGTLNDYECLAQVVTDDVAGVIVEPIQGEGGILPAHIEWLAALRRQCERVGAALIYDEIQCGLFRTGTLWCHSEMPREAHPDMVTLAKPLANGFPIGAVVMRQKIAEAIAPGDHGTTFGGNPLACRIAHHVLSRLESASLIENVHAMSRHLRARLERINEMFGDLVCTETSPRGAGLMLGISMREPAWAQQVVKLARERGVLLLTAGSDTIRFVPSLIVEREHVDHAMDVLESVLVVLRAAM